MDASRCPTCSLVDVPPSLRCPRCGSGMHAHKVTDRGRVVARTRLRGEDAWIVLVELGEQARVLARVHDRVEIGSGCRVQIQGDTATVKASEEA